MRRPDGQKADQTRNSDKDRHGSAFRFMLVSAVRSRGDHVFSAGYLLVSSYLFTQFVTTGPQSGEHLGILGVVNKVATLIWVIA